MPRYMYDAVQWQSIPRDAGMVAGYVDGPASQWPAEAWDYFTNAVKVRIAVFSSTNDGHVIDVEPGCSTATGAAAWIKMRREAGLPAPAVYCSNYNPPGYSDYAWSDVLNACAALGIDPPLKWIASWSFAPPSIPPGCIAIQYANGPDITGYNYDLSLVSDYWPGVDPDPAPSPDPAPPDNGGVTQADINNTLDRIANAEYQLAAFNAAMGENLQGMRENLTG